MEERVIILIDFNDSFKREIKRILQLSDARDWLIELFCFWIIQGKRINSPLPDFLSKASKFFFKEENHTDIPLHFNLFDVKLKNNYIELIFSATTSNQKTYFPKSEDIEGFAYSPSLRQMIKKNKYSDFRKSVYVLTLDKQRQGYVGSTIKLPTRLRVHRDDLRARRERHPVKEFLNNFTFKPNGLDNINVFVFDLKKDIDQVEKEQEFFDYFKFKGILLNRGTNARNPNKGIIRSEETIQKLKIVNRDKTLSKETRSLMSNQRKGRVNYNQDAARRSKEKVIKPIVGDGVFYESSADASRRTGKSQSTITRRASNKRYPTWYYVNSIDDPNRDTNSKMVKKRKLNSQHARTLSIEGKIFQSTVQVAKLFGFSANTIYRRCLYDPVLWPQWKDWFFIEED